MEKFKKYKWLPLLCYILCEKIIKIRHLATKQNSIDVWEDPAESNKP